MSRKIQDADPVLRIKKRCSEACLRAFDEFDENDPDYISKVYDRILWLQFDAEADIRDLIGVGGSDD